jgi:hypothetical protein
LDFEAKISLAGDTVQPGVTLTDVKGIVTLKGSVREGLLSELDGAMALDSMKFAGRDAKNFRATIHKPTDLPVVRIGDLQGDVAGGTMAGQLDFSFPEDEPGRFDLNLVVREADVKKLAGGQEADVSGRLAASLALEGEWSDQSSRRGRGDVLVLGKRMYKIPVVLGLMEIANLSLPLNSPFSEGTASYSVQGNTVTFERIALRSDQMTMAGTGSMNFATKKVKFLFSTDNPNWPRLPFVNDLISGARNELFQIRVNGTIQEPKVSAGSFSTITTTVDEVLRGNGK